MWCCFPDVITKTVLFSLKCTKNCLAARLHPDALGEFRHFPTSALFLFTMHYKPSHACAFFLFTMHYKPSPTSALFLFTMLYKPSPAIALFLFTMHYKRLLYYCASLCEVQCMLCQFCLSSCLSNISLFLSFSPVLLISADILMELLSLGMTLWQWNVKCLSFLHIWQYFRRIQQRCSYHGTL